MKKNIKIFLLILINTVLIVLFPIVVLKMTYYLEKPFRSGTTIKCIGSCEYQIIFDSSYDYGYCLINSYTYEIKASRIFKYKEDTNAKKIYIVREKSINSQDFIYSVFNYETNEINNYKNLMELENYDLKFFENENHFVKLY